MDNNTDWTQIGYNRYMERNPYLESSKYSSIQVKELFPRGSISLDRISGGQLVLGGKGNIFGSISILNESGVQIATINSSGIV